LLGVMSGIAKQRGLKKMRAMVRADNRNMLRVFESAKFERQPADEPGEVNLVLALDNE
jgi:L-amino acid N-acyltransferase YncA